MDIKGTWTSMPVNDETGDWSGAVYKVGKSNIKNSYGGDSHNQSKAGFQASKNWTGSTSGGTAHSHSFSNAATIGTGDYTRPNSVTAVMLIKY